MSMDDYNLITRYTGGSVTFVGRGDSKALYKFDQQCLALTKPQQHKVYHKIEIHFTRGPKLLPFLSSLSRTATSETKSCSHASNPRSRQCFDNKPKRSDMVSAKTEIRTNGLLCAISPDCDARNRNELHTPAPNLPHNICRDQNTYDANHWHCARTSIICSGRDVNQNPGWYHAMQTNRWLTQTKSTRGSRYNTCLLGQDPLIPRSTGAHDTV